MTKRLTATLLTAIVAIAACGGDDDPATSATTVPDVSTTVVGDLETHRLWIGPELVECEGVAPQTCMLVADSADGEAELFYDEIDGFTYVEGTSYVIDVTIEAIDDPPQDASSLRYTLVDVIESTPSGG